MSESGSGNSGNTATHFEILKNLYIYIFCRWMKDNVVLGFQKLLKYFPLSHLSVAK